MGKHSKPTGDFIFFSSFTAVSNLPSSHDAVSWSQHRRSIKSGDRTSVMPWFVYIQGGIFLSLDRSWRPPSYRPAFLDPELPGWCQESPQTDEGLEHLSHPDPADSSHCHAGRGFWMWSSAVPEDQRESVVQGAVRGAEMRARYTAWCVTMATTVCIPKITTHTYSRTVTLLQKGRKNPSNLSSFLAALQLWWKNRFSF